MYNFIWLNIYADNTIISEKYSPVKESQKTKQTNKYLGLKILQPLCVAILGATGFEPLVR